jgi:hypothetical protein
VVDELQKEEGGRWRKVDEKQQVRPVDRREEANVQEEHCYYRGRKMGLKGLAGGPRCEDALARAG